MCMCVCSSVFVCVCVCVCGVCQMNYREGGAPCKCPGCGEGHHVSVLDVGRGTM